MFVYMGGCGCIVSLWVVAVAVSLSQLNTNTLLSSCLGKPRERCNGPMIMSHNHYNYMYSIVHYSQCTLNSTLLLLLLTSASDDHAEALIMMILQWYIAFSLWANM